MNLGDKALQVLKTVAPLIGTAIGGPLGPLAGAAISAVLGTKPGDAAAASAALVNASPDQLLALKKADDDFAAQMKALDVQEEQLAYQDVASARSRQVSIKDWTPAVLAYVVTLGFFGVLTYVMHYGVKIGQGQGGEAVLILLGSLGTAWTAVVGYYFGSSVGARQSAETLGEIAKQP